MKVFAAFVAGLLLPVLTFAQLQKNPAVWSFSTDRKNVKVGDVVTVRLKAAIADGWYMYSNDFDPNLGPNLASVKFTPHPSYQLVGKAMPVGAKEKFDEIWGGNVRYFTHQALFTQKIKVLKPDPAIGGSVEYSTCSLKDGTCLPPAEADFSVAVKAVAAATAPVPTTTPTAVAPTPKATGTITAPRSQTTAVAAAAPTPAPAVTAVSTLR